MSPKQEYQAIGSLSNRSKQAQKGAEAGTTRLQGTLDNQAAASLLVYSLKTKTNGDRGGQELQADTV